MNGTARVGQPATVIAAAAIVPASPREVFAFLAQMQNHWTLAGRRLQLLRMGKAPDGNPWGEVRIRGPLGIRRRARTQVLELREPVALGGIAQVGTRTTAHVHWTLRPAGGRSTRVSLSATVSAAAPLDRLLLAAGGRLWMRRVFAATLARLDEQLRAAPHPAPALKAA